MSSAEDHPAIRFTRDDLALFCQASLDNNPLHLSERYARTTQFGQRVVFGILGALHCLGALVLEEGQTLVGLTVEFAGPILLDIDYALQRKSLSPTSWRITLTDGTRPLVKATFRLGPGGVSVATPEGPAAAARSAAADRYSDDLPVGTTCQGHYQVEGVAFAKLLERTGVAGKGIAPTRVAALLWSSYLVGMELPGRRALFNRLTLDFDDAGAAAAPLEYVATVKSYDERFGLLHSAVALSAGSAPLAHGEVRAFVRQAPEVESDDVSAWMGPRDTLAGKAALVIGASRGLGARIARALTLQGAVVYASYLRSAEEMERLVGSLGEASGRLIPIQGDAANDAWCQATIARIVEEQGGLDYLVCNACPPILPMWFDVQTAGRTARYVADSLELVGVPLAASLESLAARQGWAVVLSSVYAEKAPANFPHYVAAKCAIEGLVRSVASHHPRIAFLLVRPPRLVGELNIPFGGELVLPAGQVAGLLTRRLTGERPAGTPALLVDFLGQASGADLPIP